MKKIAILGATGSIGRQALDIIEQFPDRFKVTALTAHRSSEALLETARRLNACYVGLTGCSGDIEFEKKSAQGREGGLWHTGAY